MAIEERGMEGIKKNGKREKYYEKKQRSGVNAGIRQEVPFYNKNIL